MIVVTTTQVRPSTDIPFYVDMSPEMKEQMSQTVNASPNIMSTQFTLSEDQLTHTSVATFEDSTKLQAFLNELEAAIPGFHAARDEHSAIHGITVTRQETTA